MTHTGKLPLEGLLVLDLSLFLAGPYASLRLQDLGARVIKIERPDGGDPCRDLYKTDDTEDSTLFHAINRGKESLCLNLKDPADLETAMKLVERADVLVQNYRPGVADRLGLGYESVKARNPGIVYASISGYGPTGEWAHLPGQDLLAQARSGIMWLSGNADAPPTPTGLALADIYTGALAVQGILAGLVGRGVSGEGCKVETSLLESMLDMQFEMLAHYLNNDRTPPRRSTVANANVTAPPPYGVYKASDGYLALAMTPLRALLDLLGVEVEGFDPDDVKTGDRRDILKAQIADAVATRSCADWLAVLEPAGIWCAEVLDWERMLASSQFKSLDMLQTLPQSDGTPFSTMAVPFQINGVRAKGDRGAPKLGEHTHDILVELGVQTPATKRVSEAVI